MIKLNGKPVEINKFPDGTLLLKEEYNRHPAPESIEWRFESNEELTALAFLTYHLRDKGAEHIELKMWYIPNARQDRGKKPEDVFTLKYFARLINALKFDRVYVLDPHSSVSEALFDNLVICTPEFLIGDVYDKISALVGNEDTVMFYPDEGAMKRYSGMVSKPYAFGIKERDWSSGQIKGLSVFGADVVKGKNVLIVDDISSRGGTFYHSAKKLKELGAAKVFLYVTHCENTILEGEVLTSGLIEKVYTTDSLFTQTHEKIEVIEL